MNLQWQVGAHCLATWSEDHVLYKASVVEVDERKRVCKVKYDDYDNTEECPWVELCPLYAMSGRRLSTDDRHQHDRARQVCVTPSTHSEISEIYYLVFYCTLLQINYWLLL